MREMLLGAYIRQKRLELGLTRQQGGKFFISGDHPYHFCFRFIKPTKKGRPSRAAPLLLLLIDIEAHPALDLPGGVVQALVPGEVRTRRLRDDVKYIGVPRICSIPRF